MNKKLYHICLSGSSGEASYVVKDLSESEVKLLTDIFDILKNEREEVVMTELPCLNDAMDEYLKYLDEKEVHPNERGFYLTAFGFVSRKYCNMHALATDWLAITLSRMFQDTHQGDTK